MTGRDILGDPFPFTGFFLLIGLMSLVLVSVSSSAYSVSSLPSRSTVIYEAEIEGDGEDNDTLLAGHRWYDCNFTFSEWTGEVDNASVLIERGEGEELLFQFDPETTEISVEDLSGQVEIGEPSISSIPGGDTLFSFRLWIHLNWTFQSQVTLEPVIISNGTELELDSPRLLRFEIFGYLETNIERIMIRDNTGNEVRTGEAVSANSTITISGLSFSYDDTSGEFSDLEPEQLEIDPVVIYDDRKFNTTLVPGGFTGQIHMPDVETGSIQMTIDIPGVKQDWKLDLISWSFSLDIDGLGPRIEITKPAPGKTQAESEFIWNVTITDRPVSAGVNVNGSSVMYRVWTKTSNWTEWLETEDAPDARSIQIAGTATGIPGSGSTLIQFRCRDVLGNSNDIDPYPVTINRPPTLNISQVIGSLEIMNNRSLILDGTLYASDPDDDDLDYKWYLDDSEPLSTLSDFKKPLFDIQPGEHSIRLEVTDGYEKVSDTFTITVLEAPNDEENLNWMEKLMEDENLFWYLLPVALLLLLIPLIVLILFVSRKASERKRDDFIIDEDRSMDMSQAEETARRIMETMSSRESADFETADAVTSDDGFDFDYNLYDVLGLDQASTDVELKKKYRKLAAYYHPDRVALHGEISDEDAREEMVKINKAKEVLLDPEIRSLYDSYISDMDFSMDMDDLTMDDGDFDDDWD